jgi:hypothetical protein
VDGLLRLNGLLVKYVSILIIKSIFYFLFSTKGISRLLKKLT